LSVHGAEAEKGETVRGKERDKNCDHISMFRAGRKEKGSKKTKNCKLSKKRGEGEGKRGKGLWKWEGGQVWGGKNLFLYGGGLITDWLIRGHD